MPRSEISRGKFLSGKREEEVCLSEVIFHSVKSLIFYSVSTIFSKHTHTEAERNCIYFFRDFSGFLMRVLRCNLPGMLVRLRSTLNFACCQSDVKFKLGAIKVESKENK